MCPGTRNRRVMSVSGRANNDNVRWEVKSLLAGAVNCEQRHLSRDLQLQKQSVYKLYM